MPPLQAGMYSSGMCGGLAIGVHAVPQVMQVHEDAATLLCHLELVCLHLVVLLSRPELEGPRGELLLDVVEPL
eukprot:2616519-Lingulodinium_polyedra.AAC.2